MCIAALAVMVSVGVIVTRLAADELEGEGAERAELAHTAAQAALAARGDLVERQLTAVAPDVADAVTSDVSALERAMDDARRAAALDLLILTATDGQVRASSRTEPVRASGVAAPRDTVLARGQAEGQLVRADAPLRGDDGSLAGTLVAGQWVDDELLAELAGPLEVTLAVVDARGRLVASGARAGTSPSLADTYSAAQPFGPGDDALRLVAAVPRSAVDDLERELLRALAIAGGGALVLLSIAVLAAVRPLTRSIRRLTGAARAAARGEPVRTVPPGDAPDTRELSRALNGVVGRLSSQLHEDEQGRQELRLALDRMSDAFTLTQGLPAMMGVLVESAARVVDARTALLFSINTARGRLDVRSAYGPDLPSESLPIGDGLAGWVAQHGEVVVWPGPVAPATAEPTSGGRAPSVAMPLRSSGRIMGVLAVYAEPDRPPFDAEEVDTLQLLVRQAGSAVDNVLLHEEVKRQSITDGLTGVWNRRHFEMRSAEELRSAARFHDPFGIVMIDVDHFKDVNDRYGHQVGDAVLIEIARRISGAVREIDVVARYGGEEFSLLVPRAELEETGKVAERVWQSVNAEPFRVDSLVLSVTVSVGLACHPQHGASVRELVAAADDAMYRAKQLGRNRVERATTGDIGVDDGRPPDGEPSPVSEATEAVPEGSAG